MLSFLTTDKWLSVSSFTGVGSLRQCISCKYLITIFTGVITLYMFCTYYPRCEELEVESGVDLLRLTAVRCTDCTVFYVLTAEVKRRTRAQFSAMILQNDNKTAWDRKPEQLTQK